MDTFCTPRTLNIEDNVFDKYFFRAGGAQVTRVQAKVANEYESGTDCTVTLRLRNAGTTETCNTGDLDDDGNSWARDGWEDYSFAKADEVCMQATDYFHFRPGNNLQFKFIFDPLPLLGLFGDCFDHLQLTWVRVYFGRKYYEWSGQHWWNPSSKWMNFDSMGGMD